MTENQFIIRMLEKRILRLEMQLSQLHSMVRAINARTLTSRDELTKSYTNEPNFAQEYQGEFDMKDES